MNTLTEIQSLLDRLEFILGENDNNYIAINSEYNEIIFKLRNLQVKAEQMLKEV